MFKGIPPLGYLLCMGAILEVWRGFVSVWFIVDGVIGYKVVARYLYSANDH